MPGLPLDERMKRYEFVSRYTMTPRAPMIVRVDGRAFHTYTRGCPLWDQTIEDGMTRVAVALVREIAGSKMAYVQSDECSVLVNDYETLGTQPWFGKSVQKVASVSASIATAAFGQPIEGRTATFDSRAFVVPREDAANYFVWRQQDAVKNSVQSLAQEHFTQRELVGLHGGELQELLFQGRGINWNDTPPHRKRGWCVTRAGVDREPPTFTQDRNYIERHLQELAE